MDSDTEQNPNSRPDSPSSSIAAWSPVPMNFIRSPSYSPTSPTYILTSPDDSPRSPSYSPSPIYTPYDLGSPATIVLNSEDSDYISSPDYNENSLDNRFSVVFSPSPQHLDATQDSQYGPSSPDSLRSVSPIEIERRATHSPSLQPVDYDQYFAPNLDGASTSKNSVESLKARVRDLEKENEKLKRDFTCIICLTERRNSIFMPCCHFNTCEGCAAKLELCAVCRSEIRGRLKIFEN